MAKMLTLMALKLKKTQKDICEISNKWLDWQEKLLKFEFSII